MTEQTEYQKLEAQLEAALKENARLRQKVNQLMVYFATQSSMMAQLADRNIEK